MREQRIAGTNEDDIIYADNTICTAQDEQAMNKLLASIEKEGKNYGLRLSKTHCEHLYFGDVGPARFSDGTRVPKMQEVKHRGCQLNNKGDPAREVGRRISDCVATLNKPHVFFYAFDNKVARAVQVFVVVIRSKPLYGLESVVMNTTVLRILDTCHIKSIR